MKKSLFLLWFSCAGLTTITLAQSKTVPKATIQQSLKKQSEAEVSTATTSFVSTGVNQAFAGGSNLYIADPTIRTLNQRAAGSKLSIGSSGIVGMPKRAYGFANGKILLRSTTAPSSGTVYGSGSVGTGTSISGLGTSENVPGVNGKSPYASSSLWGTKQSPDQALGVDSTKKQ